MVSKELSAQVGFGGVIKVHLKISSCDKILNLMHKIGTPMIYIYHLNVSVCAGK